MSIPSPANVSGLYSSYTITVNGATLNDNYPLVSIRTFYEINKIPYAEIVLIDGAVDTGDFPISETADLIPGSEIAISAGYESKNELIFKGVIVKQAIKISNDSSSNLVVTCKHKAVQMTYNRIDAVFSDKKDSDIITSVIGTYGLTKTVEATTVTYENIFQKAATDWDFIISRADCCGFVTSFDVDAIKIGKPNLSSAAVLLVTYGESMFSLDAQLDSENQASAIDAQGWDPAQQKTATSSASEPTLNSHGNIKPKSLSEVLSQKKLILNSGTPMADNQLKAWADSKLLRMRLSAIRGSVSFNGNSKVSPGKLIQLAGLGERFNGDAYVSAVEHTIEDGVWTTRVGFGLDSKPISELPDFSYSSAAGQFPAIHGLQVGIVKKLAADPQNEFRVQVLIPNVSDDKGLLWARMSNISATNSSGFYFLPEIGDEVILGFLDGNSAHAVILGSLYSSKHPTAFTADDKNNTKAITTKSKLEINFDEEKKIIKIFTPGGNSITLDDDAKGITIKDQNNNTVKMNSSGVEINSPKNIVLKATGNITLDATGKLALSSKQDVAIEGLNIANTAKVGFTAKGNATAEISASGQTTVKGAIVMIN